MDKRNHIEQLFGKVFADYTGKPDENTWKIIDRRLRRRNFMKFSFYRFNIWYAGALLIAIALPMVIALTKGSESFIKPLENDVQYVDYKEDNSLPESKLQLEDLEKKACPPKLEIKKITSPKVSVTKHEIPKFEISEINNENTPAANLKEENPQAIIASKQTIDWGIDFSIEESEACAPVNVHFSTLCEACNQVVWDFGNGEVSKEKNPTVHYSVPGVYKVKLTGYKEGKSVSVSKQIRIHESAKASFVVANKEPLFINTPIKFINGKITNYSCKWMINSEFESSSAYNFIHVFEEPGIYNICLICTSSDGCRDTFVMNNLQVRKKEYEISAPNALCLNMNGAQSGYWKIHTAGVSVFYPIISPEPESYELRIYNKFGKHLFTSTDYSYGWNGYYNNMPVPQGVYVWECRGKFSNGKTFRKKGSITVLHTNQ